MKKKNGNLKVNIVKTSSFMLLELLLTIGFFSKGDMLWGWLFIISFLLSTVVLFDDINKFRKNKDIIEIT